MNKNHKVPAFTIFEAAVTMIITAIILIFAYQIFGVAQQQLLHYIKLQDEVISYEQFTTQFSIDVQLAQKITSDNDEITLSIDENRVNYAFAKAYTLRTSHSIDTLNITVNTILIDTLTTNTTEFLNIELQTDLLGKPIKIYEEKQLGIDGSINSLFL